MAKYDYNTLYEALKAQGAFEGAQTLTFGGTFSIDLTAYQNAVLKLDFKDFTDEQFANPITATAAAPSLEQLIGVNANGENAHIPNTSDANIIANADRVIINAKKDFGLLFGQKGVALASPSRVNLDAGQSITLFGHDNVFLGIPNKGNKIPDKQPDLGPTKGHPTPDQEYDPLVLGLKLANLLEDILFVLKSAELVSGVSPVKFQPSTQAEFGLLANRIPEILSNYAYIDGLSHEQIDTKQLETLKAQQKKVEKFKPPTQLEGAIEGTTGLPVGTPGSTPAGLDFTPVPSSVTPTESDYILVEGGHGAYWPQGNPYSNKPDPKIGAGDGDNLHSFTSDIPAHPGRTMDIQVEAALREFKTKTGKNADIVGMVVQMNQKAATKQVVWKVLIQESKNGIHYKNFRSRGSAKAKDKSLESTMSQINAGASLKNFKKVYLFQHDIGGLLITQAFAIYS
jgi:hypothetical protein